MKLRNLFLILLAQTLGWTGISAQSIDAEDAAARARDFFQRQQSTTVGVHKAQAVVKPVLAYTATTANTPDFYVFNRAEDLPGFVIVNADATSTTEILGYSEMSTFDYDTAPDNFKWWLQQYQTNGVSKAPAKAAAQRHDVDYLCKTKWNQDEPYWNAINQAVGNYGFVTGCAATSMAQVMKFYEYPEHGVGNYAYTINYNGGALPLTFSADFANTTYDWANMLDDYSQGYTQTQADAVATLMYHCGVAQDMVYNSAGAGGSGAYTGKNGQAMLDYFEYDKSMLLAYRLFYLDEDWNELIYNEVANGRPVLYSGQSTGGGHSFICDGYNNDEGTYHFNWGWGGYCDGYYALVGPGALTPNGSGIGGSTTGDGYTGSQAAIINIKPDEGGLPGVFLYIMEGLELSDNGGVLASNSTIDLKGGAKTISFKYRIGCNSYDNSSFNTGIELRHSVTGESLYLFGYMGNEKASGQLSQGYSYTNPWTCSTELKASQFCNGKYEVYPAFYVHGTWHRGYHDPAYTMPSIVIEGSSDPVDIDVPLTISATQVMVGNSVSISHGDYYDGIITYESNNPEVASVSDDGVVTGLAIGEATITAKAEAAQGFNATTKTFKIQVVEHIAKKVLFSTPESLLTIGETASFTAKAPYDGTVTYTAIPEGVVTIDADGTIHAVSQGNVMIYAHAEGTYDYKAGEAYAAISVVDVPEQTGFVDFVTWPTFGSTNGVVSGEDATLSIYIRNNSNSQRATTLECVFTDVDGNLIDRNIWTFYDNSLNSGQSAKVNIDFSSIMNVFTPGEFYYMWLFRDWTGYFETTPRMNVEKIKFRFESPEPKAGELTKIIRNMQGDAPQGTLFDVESVKCKILKK